MARKVWSQDVMVILVYSQNARVIEATYLALNLPGNLAMGCCLTLRDVFLLQWNLFRNDVTDIPGSVCSR